MHTFIPDRYVFGDNNSSDNSFYTSRINTGFIK
jgi:hypothetical protein